MASSYFGGSLMGMKKGLELVRSTTFLLSTGEEGRDIVLLTRGKYSKISVLQFLMFRVKYMQCYL